VSRLPGAARLVIRFGATRSRRSPPAAAPASALPLAPPELMQLDVLMTNLRHRHSVTSDQALELLLAIARCLPMLVRQQARSEWPKSPNLRFSRSGIPAYAVKHYHKIVSPARWELDHVASFIGPQILQTGLYKHSKHCCCCRRCTRCPHPTSLPPPRRESGLRSVQGSNPEPLTEEGQVVNNKLTDTRRVILAAAAARDSGEVLPVPTSLGFKGGHAIAGAQQSARAWPSAGTTGE
jgi:hypothetical protein